MPDAPAVVTAPSPQVDKRLDTLLRVSGREASFRLRIAAEQLMLRRAADQPGRIARALRRAVIDLNPHQVEAAVAGLRALNRNGLVLADEVGLGKTIEAGLVLAQLAAEGRSRLLVLTPATLRKQWAVELEQKLGIGSELVDGDTAAKDRKNGRHPFDREGRIVIASHPFAARRAGELRAIPWDCVVIDEAHRLRGAHRGSKTARALRDALDDRPKLLLTATPLQNGLGELYGILSLLDDDLLGPFEEFRRMYPDALDVDSAVALRARVRPYIHRTLRRQVREYVRYTDRRSIVCEFTPTPEEAHLYDEVSKYLSEPETFALDPARRPLMVMVYRKLLASSPAAIAGTLGALASGLEARLERGDHDPETPEDSDVLEILSGLDEDPDAEGGVDRPKQRPPATPSRLREEIDRLRSLEALARSIKFPAKCAALLRALERAFVEATSRGWPKKAVIFTESRRTQEALAAALEESGYRGKVQMLHGGSGNAEARAAIVEAFRNQAQILINTEAGAEGLNLQFANLVVNYDLPWNPQRIEQRIGRCHRYGQSRDVVVLNFLASDNEAEARLYELLSKKLQLFDGVFGATDEPLGALGDGHEFERRVFDIFQSCRDETAIQSAFDALQAELDDRIQAKMREARAKICDHFDDEIRARLRFTGNAAEDALDQDEEALVSLITGAIPGARLDKDGRLHLPEDVEGGAVLDTSHKSRNKGSGFLTVDHPVAAPLIAKLRKESAGDVRYVLFDYTKNGHKISRLAPLLGSEGWWLVYRVSFEGCLGEDNLVHVVLAKTAEGEIVILDDSQIEALLTVRAVDIDKRQRLRAVTLASTHAEQALEPRVRALAGTARTRADAELDRQRESIDLAFEDTLRALRETTLAAEASWHRARERARAEGEASGASLAAEVAGAKGSGPSGPAAAAEIAARAKDAAQESARLFRELEKALDREADERRTALARRAERLAEVGRRSDLGMTRTLIATAYFWLE